MENTRGFHPTKKFQKSPFTPGFVDGNWNTGWIALGDMDCPVWIEKESDLYLEWLAYEEAMRQRRESPK